MGLSNWGVDMTIFLPPLGRMVLSYPSPPPPPPPPSSPWCQDKLHHEVGHPIFEGPSIPHHECEQIDPCSGCYISSGVCFTGSFRTQWTWQTAIALFYTRRGSWATMASHAWIVCMLSLRSLWHPPCPWYSSNHGHERGNFELDWFLLLELRLCA